MDTIGAVIGPFVAFLLVDGFGYRALFFVALIPGLLAVASFVFLTTEAPHRNTSRAAFWSNIKSFPHEFRMFLLVMAVFGAGDFAHTLLIMSASQSMQPVMSAHEAGQFAILLYTWHNIIYAAAAYPAGVLADKFGKKRMLLIGFACAGVMALGFGS